jgi:hypothetical protein
MINPYGKKVTSGERERKKEERKAVNSGHLAMSAQRRSAQNY